MILIWSSLDDYIYFILLLHNINLKYNFNEYTNNSLIVNRINTEDIQLISLFSVFFTSHLFQII